MHVITQRIILTLALLGSGAMTLLAQPVPPAPNTRVKHWRTLRVGLFIHWGPSSDKVLPQSQWQTILKHTGTLGGPPILEFSPIRTRYVQRALTRFRAHPIQVSELRFFAPLEK